MAVTGYHRKAVIRHLRPSRARPFGAHPVGRPRRYGPAEAAAATVLWETARQVGAKRPRLPSGLEPPLRLPKELDAALTVLWPGVGAPRRKR
jgi:hypothetical protein